MSDLPPPLFPFDEHNRRLRSHVHPDHWRNPVPNGPYNLVVIGGGTAGLVTAAGAAGLGAKVALIERDLLGGDCLNTGCVPSKAILATARRIARIRSADDLGIQIPTPPHADFATVMERMRRLRAAISPHDSAERFQSLGVDVHLGTARFLDTHTVEVAGQRLAFRKACIATGARAAVPRIPGIDSVPFLTNETVFSLTEAPRRLGVVGAGPIGCELAQAFARLGSRVVLVETASGILPREDPEASAVVRSALERDGIEILCCGRDLRVDPTGNGEIRLRIESGGRRHETSVDRLLIAAGRTANVEGLGLEALGVATDSHGVVVNDRLQTSVPHIYAAGDVCSRLRFTHAADFMARIVIRNALFLGRARFSDLTIPWATYTDPELAHVGLHAASAQERGIGIDTFTVPMETVDRAILEGETGGFARLHVRKGTDRIVGATIVAPHAGDLIGEVSLAMTRGIGLGAIAGVIHPYPTTAEAIRKAGDLYNRTRLTPRVAGLMRAWLRWSRR